MNVYHGLTIIYIFFIKPLICHAPILHLPLSDPSYTYARFIIDFPSCAHDMLTPCILKPGNQMNTLINKLFLLDASSATSEETGKEGRMLPDIL